MFENRVDADRLSPMNSAMLPQRLKRNEIDKLAQKNRRCCWMSHKSRDLCLVLKRVEWRYDDCTGLLFQRPITTICWGHRDSRLFLACGPALYVVRVEHRVASLQLLCQQGIASALREEKDVGKLNMPSLLCSYVTSAFIPTIKVRGRCLKPTCSLVPKYRNADVFSLGGATILQPFPLFVLAPNSWPQQHPGLCQLSHSWEREAPLHHEEGGR